MISWLLALLALSQVPYELLALVSLKIHCIGCYLHVEGCFSTIFNPDTNCIFNIILYLPKLT